MKNKIGRFIHTIFRMLFLSIVDFIEEFARIVVAGWCLMAVIYIYDLYRYSIHEHRNTNYSLEFRLKRLLTYLLIVIILWWYL